ncbi:molybdopterin-binding protein [Clostridium botulinum]|nr:molybdopterin-binding protein [Clostridium botulinum]NFI17974.1 molybdopterin-binding protein [Clostridium botulinum]NFI52591.1 molybdopterin-binding protein [Clostridium botulinum]NFL92760.1 molybdopterin-binding protein [Clostridium botulinum]NFN50419.1 molybdopterin-binding protein [Clostridium botulinum]
MKLIDTKNSVGHVLCHDITQIIKDVKKGTAFRKGHIVTEEDIPVLLSLGKDHLYVWEKKEGFFHENEAAEVLLKICKNDNMTNSEVKEGKIELIASCEGLLKIDIDKLKKINMLDEIIIATRHNNTIVKKGDKLAGMRVIPLIIDGKKLESAKKIGESVPIIELKNFVKKKVGIVTTGNEVYYGRIKDTFSPVIKEKLSKFDVEIIGQTIVNDDTDNITNAIRLYIDKGANMVICTGGMSVDPDDLTPSAIKSTGAKIISYGAPVLPGAMFLLSYYNDNIPILGLPGCVMYAKQTIFDLVLPRIMADEKISKDDLASLGHGGLCLSCEKCTYPNCGFGKI